MLSAPCSASMVLTYDLLEPGVIVFLVVESPCQGQSLDDDSPSGMASPTLPSVYGSYAGYVAL